MINEYNKAISKEINEALAKRGMNDTKLRIELETLGIDIGASTISKILNFDPNKHPDYKVPLIYIAGICRVLDLDLSDIPIGDDRSGTGNWIPQNLGNSSGGLISNPDDMAFRGYINNTFDVFFLSTVSQDRQMMTGTMTLLKKDKRCEVKLFVNSSPIKEYTGEMRISTHQNACYGVVEGVGFSAVRSFVFAWRELRGDDFKVRIAVATTIAAGNEPYPTMHRLVICKQGVIKNDKQRQFIHSQLRMNRFQIIISEENFEQLRTHEEIGHVIEALGSTKQHLKPYYALEEDEILNIRSKFSNITKSECDEALALLRINSVAHRHNKIGAKADNILYHYLFPTSDSNPL